jgi:hypothetical protein
MTTYFSCGVHRAELEFRDEATAIAFAQQMARTLLEVANGNGDVLARMRVTRPLHSARILQAGEGFRATSVDITSKLMEAGSARLPASRRIAC